MTAWQARSGVLALALLAVAPPAQAQDVTGTASGRPWVVSVAHWAKWGTLASAIGLTAVAIFRSNDANEVFVGLNRFCAQVPSACLLDANGRYVDAAAEALYQETLRLDRQARTWMIGGQIALAASGVFFLIDLVTGDEGPKNIPFAPLEAFTTGTRTGLRIRF